MNRPSWLWMGVEGALIVCMLCVVWNKYPDRFYRHAMKREDPNARVPSVPR